MDVLNEWLKNRAVNSNTFVEIVVCRDGYSFSCEANKWAHCNPRELGAYPYSSVELGFPSDQDELIDIYAEDKDPGFDCVTGDVDAVYPYVPVQTVIKLIKKHGGFKDGPSKADIDILEAGYKLIEPSFGRHITYAKHITNHIIRVIDINKSTLEIKCYRKHIMGDIKYSVMTKAEKRLFNAKLEEIEKGENKQ